MPKQLTPEDAAAAVGKLPRARMAVAPVESEPAAPAALPLKPSPHRSHGQTRPAPSWCVSTSTPATCSGAEGGRLHAVQLPG
jgi:hypothetical protein